MLAMLLFIAMSGDLYTIVCKIIDVLNAQEIVDSIYGHHDLKDTYELCKADFLFSECKVSCLSF